MTRENVELHARGYDAFDRRDFDAFLALAHPSAEFTPFNMTVEGGRPDRGHDGVRRYWRDFIDVFPDLRVEVKAIRGRGYLDAQEALAAAGLLE